MTPVKREPLVMCLTNTVAANWTANVLLAVGAKPAMMSQSEEAAALAAVSDAVLVNVGTVDDRQAQAMRSAITACREKGVPWVLDPVAAHLLEYRRSLVAEFLSLGPSVVRGNRAEIEGIAEMIRPGTITLATGETDIIDGPARRTVTGGVEMLTKVTATGCAQGAVVAAFLGRGLEPTTAALSASVLMKRSGERAWEHSHSPGTFQIALLDALFEIGLDMKGMEKIS